jgi:site-specific recombinase XerC
VSFAPAPHGHPNQLRHAHATEVRKRFGLEAAQVALGHETADLTQVYAERDSVGVPRLTRDLTVSANSTGGLNVG